MKRDKLILYIIEISLIISSLCFIFFIEVFTKAIMSIILLLFVIITNKLVKTYKTKGKYNRKLTKLMIIIGIVYIAGLYVLGIYIGFYNATVKFSRWSIINYIIPYTVIIILTENIRKPILLKEDKKSNILILIATVILDIAITTNISSIKTLNDYFMLIGFITFSSIANNMLYNYIIIKYKNCKAIIGYRLITILYVYFIPIIPNLHILFETIIRIIVPYIIYLIIEANYAKKEKDFSTTRGRKTKETVILSIFIILAINVLMLVSCQFTYGALVIGSGSMTGTINKGDIIIYKKLDDAVKVGDIIVFNYNGTRIIHRVVDAKNFGTGEYYYTKGDANSDRDEGYRVEDDIIGKVKFRIPYIGQITLLINDLFN